MRKMLQYVAPAGCLLLSGRNLAPDIAHQPTLHNPFPQLSKLALAPFFNSSTEPTVDGQRVPLAKTEFKTQTPPFEKIRSEHPATGPLGGAGETRVVWRWPTIR
jgi:hypothetical protein